MKKTVLLTIIIISTLIFSSELKKVKAFRIKNMEGEIVHLDSIVAKGPALINFWASWCKPCKEELPVFKKIDEEFSEKGLQTLLITIDKPSQVMKANNFLITKAIGLPLLRDCTKKVFKSFGGGRSIPMTFLLNTKREVVFKKKGQIKYKELKKEISKILL